MIERIFFTSSSFTLSLLSSSKSLSWLCKPLSSSPSLSMAFATSPTCQGYLKPLASPTSPLLSPSLRCKTLLSTLVWQFHNFERLPLWESHPPGVLGSSLHWQVQRSNVQGCPPHPEDLPPSSSALTSFHQCQTSPPCQCCSGSV